MKKIVFASLAAIAAFFTSCGSQPVNNTEIEDRLALKNLVDTFSTLADVKDIDTQVLLFTPDAEVTSHVGNQPGSTIKGREALAEAFGNYLSLFDIVYHINGQFTVTIDGDTAKGISYCQVTLIGGEEGKKNNLTQGVIYHDEYVKIDGRWYINKRESYFTWTTNTPYGEQK